MVRKIGWIGTGVTGKSMCAHLIKAGHEISVYNRTKEKTNVLIELGAKYVDSPKKIAESCDLIFTMVGFPNDVRNIYFGENGIISGVQQNAIVVDMTTSEPKIASKIYDALKEKGVHALDAPISGDELAARNKKVVFTVGGDEEIFELVEPYFLEMGIAAEYMGKSGSGQHTKLANQIAVASTMIGVVETLIYSAKAGLDLKKVIDVIEKGTGESWSMGKYGTRIRKKEYESGFFLKHFVKDMGIALKESRRMKIALPGLAQVYQFYQMAMNLGYDNMGPQAIYQVFAQMNGIDS
jgi:3-hydroxyisobutyrate dehydrogenase